MPRAIQAPLGPPAGFPDCPRCTYLRSGPPSLCLECASAQFEGIARGACPICSQILEHGSCPNWLCADPGRRISRISAIAYSSGELRRMIVRYKYHDKYGWALIFGRLLVGWLETHAAADRPDLIVVNPTYLAPGVAGPGHTEAVLAAAEREDVGSTWTFDTLTPPAIVKVGHTRKSAATAASAKRSAARELRSALSVPDPRRTKGRYVLVYDDVCTTGSQLNAVADCLLSDGQVARVEGVVLARQPWRSSRQDGR